MSKEDPSQFMCSVCNQRGNLVLVATAPDWYVCQACRVVHFQPKK